MLGDKLVPDFAVLLRPPVRTGLHDIMRHYIVIPESRNNGDGVLSAKDLGEFVHHELIQADDLICRAGIPLIIVMPCRVTSPDDKVNLVFKVVLNPAKCLVNEGNWRVAFSLFGAIVPGGALTSVAALFVGCSGLVKGVWMKIWKWLACPFCPLSSDIE